MHEEPIPSLKEAKTEEDDAKNFKPKNNTPHISQEGTTLEEPTNNINEESDLEEETKVVKEKPSATEYKKNVLSILIYNDTDSSVSKRIFNQQYLDVLTDYFSKVFNRYLNEHTYEERIFSQLIEIASECDKMADEFSFNNNFVSRASFHKNRIILSIAEIQTQSSSKEPKKTLETAIKRKTSTENHLVINMLFQGFSNLIADIICYFPNFEDLYKFLEDNDEKKLEYRTDLFSNRLIFSPIKSKYRMESIDDLSFKNLNLRVLKIFSKYKASKDLPDSNIIDSLCDTEVTTNKFTEFLKKLEVKEKKKPNQGKSKIFCILNLNEKDKYYEKIGFKQKDEINNEKEKNDETLENMDSQRFKPLTHGKCMLEIYSMCEIQRGDNKKTEETIKDIDARTINLIQNKFKKIILNFFRNSYEKFLDKNTREKVYSEIMEDWVLVKIN
ncbi:hypothetical protein CWI36_0603p0030 [Hamiltosporidium magnivora]|uniref:Uncharacterized protein n=1 Tax=Hamiltosporidium magnivora TaxID=148818 RepID=A0A4Q9LCW3_9MICR|nr:hypothetical protein CWI36_0603p0030 [Hamiltosporidium magnivora]